MRTYKNQCLALGAVLQTAEHDYVKLGLHYHVLISTVDLETSLSMSFGNTLTEAFVLASGARLELNPMMAKLQYLHLLRDRITRLTLTKRDDPQELQELRYKIHEAAELLKAFQADVKDLQTQVNEITALSGLEEITLDNQTDEQPACSRSISFRANISLWSWLVEVPLLKDWVAQGTVKTDEQAFLKAVKLGSEKVQRAILWMSEGEAVATEKARAQRAQEKQTEAAQGMPGYNLSMRSLPFR